MQVREDEKDCLFGNLLAVAPRANRVDLVFNAAKAAAHLRHSGRSGLGVFRGARIEKVETALARLVRPSETFVVFRRVRAPGLHVVL